MPPILEVKNFANSGRKGSSKVNLPAGSVLLLLGRGGGSMLCDVSSSMESTGSRTSPSSFLHSLDSEHTGGSVSDAVISNMT